MTIKKSIQLRPFVVFDCNIYLQAVIRDNGPSFACLSAAEAGFVQLLVSPAVITEVKNVLKRDTLQRKFSALKPLLVDAFLSRISSFAVTKENVPLVFAYPRDPKDEPYINLAIAGKAEYLVSRDKDLLDLMNQKNPESTLFRKNFPNITIVTPVEFLSILRESIN